MRERERESENAVTRILERSKYQEEMRGELGWCCHMCLIRQATSTFLTVLHGCHNSNNNFLGLGDFFFFQSIYCKMLCEIYVKLKQSRFFFVLFGG